MKTLTKLQLTGIAIFFLGAISLHAQNKAHKAVHQDTSACLEVTGNFDGTVKDFDGMYTAKLILDNKVIDQQTLKVKKSFNFVLQKNRYYAIRVEKEGFIAKTIVISTKLDYNVESSDMFKFKFETNLISDDLYGRFDDDDVDFPVALVSYSQSCECFQYNREYTASLMNSLIKNLIFGTKNNSI